MIIKQILLKQGKTVDAANISGHQEIQTALDQLGIAHPKTVIVLAGGAGGMAQQDGYAIRKAISVIAKIAEETGSALIDGGSRAGVMLEIGKQRKSKGYSFPLIGVIYADLLQQKAPQSILDSNHTHFIFVPGDHWGDESPWIAKIATALAGKEKSMTILVNGGKISREDVENSLRENRPAIIMRGTGRLADEITQTDNIFVVDISQKRTELLSFLKSKLS